MRRISSTLAMAGIVGLAACDSGITEPPEALTRAEVTELADAMSLEAFTAAEAGAEADVSPDGAVTFDAGAAVPVTYTREFTETVQCPAGGTVVTSGTATGERDREARSWSRELSATRTYTVCGFPVGDVALTVDGSLSLEASMARVAGEPQGTQSVSLVGSFDWSTADGREGTCDVDMHASFAPDTHTRTVTGDFCGRHVSIRRAWHFGP